MMDSMRSAYSFEVEEVRMRTSLWKVSGNSLMYGWNI
jgi:hypothetical protein